MLMSILLLIIVIMIVVVIIIVIIVAVVAVVVVIVLGAVVNADHVEVVVCGVEVFRHGQADPADVPNPAREGPSRVSSGHLASSSILFVLCAI